MIDLRRLVFLAVVALWSTHAAASTTFPAAVDQHLKLTGSMTIEKAVAPPDGCLLCHMTEVGGLGTNNKFGTELLNHGAMPAEPSTVAPALDAIEASDPHAIDDIVMGVNPNDDLTMPIQALPQPGYGCATAPARTSQRPDWAPLFLAPIVLLAACARRGGRARAHKSQ